MSGESYIKKPCQHCPFRRDVTPFLHPERAEEIAYAALNPYNSFPCHKTLEHDEDSDDGYSAETSKECAGFLTIRAAHSDEGIPEGFEPDWDACYTDHGEMIDAYAIEWKKQGRTT